MSRTGANKTAASMWVLRALAVVGLALALGACSKCDVPDFTHWGSPRPPHSCHDGPAQQ
jgi:hypothetical protein